MHSTLGRSHICRTARRPLQQWRSHERSRNQPQSDRTARHVHCPPYHLCINPAHRRGRIFTRAASDAAVPADPDSKSRNEPSTPPKPNMFQRVLQFLSSVSPKAESGHLLKTTLTLLKKYWWALVLLFLARDGLQFLLHRITHRLTNLAAEAVFEYPMSSLVVNPWWLVLDAEFLEQHSGYQLMMVVFFILALPFNLLLNCGSTAIMMLLTTKHSRQQAATATEAAAAPTAAATEAPSSSATDSPAATGAQDSEPGSSTVPGSEAPTSSSKAAAADTTAETTIPPASAPAPAPTTPPADNLTSSSPSSSSSGNGADALTKPPPAPSANGSTSTSSAGSTSTTPSPSGSTAEGNGDASPTSSSTVSAAPLSTGSTAGTGDGTSTSTGSVPVNGGASVNGESKGEPSVETASTSKEDKSDSKSAAVKEVSSSAAAQAVADGATSSSSGNGSDSKDSASESASSKDSKPADVKASSVPPSTPSPSTSSSPEQPIKGPRHAVAEIKSMMPEVWSIMGRIWWVELLASGASLALQGFMMLIIPVIWTLPWLLSIQLALAGSVLKGHKGLKALRQSHEMMQGYRPAYFWPYFSLLLAVRVVDTLRAGAFALMPNRYWTDAIEIPIIVYILIALLRFAVTRLQDLLPLAAFLRISEGKAIKVPTTEDTSPSPPAADSNVKPVPSTSL